ASARQLQGALARAFGRHPLDRRKLHVPYRRALGLADPLVDSLADPLFYARAIHFAATLLVAGAVLFVVFVAAPAWRGAGAGTVAIKGRTRVCRIAWISLALAAISGAAWLVLTAAAMSGLSAAQVFGGGVLWTVLTQT